MFRKVLIANRGEIAVRITKTLQEMGIRVVTVYSDMDAQAPHVQIADEAWPLVGGTLAETYLNSNALLQIAQAAGVEAIHPGYGFLSENAPFAQACADRGFMFIGPSPQVIASMGDKIMAKERMTQAGVPVVPGWSGNIQDLAIVRDAAQHMGYPVLVKAAAGGGGKGMRLVHHPDELLAAIEGATREAQAAFGDGRVFLEKYIPRPRHVEIQILADLHGHVVHLFERECSIQRRHQKIVEESPSPVLTPDLRQAMGEAALQAATAIGYTNAGTVEFILDPDGRFYFLEVNTRLQVEHPVTEQVTGLDLVRLQVEIAQGNPLPFTQPDLVQRGHAIECRIYAEDPENHFFPSTGTLHVYHEPSGPGIRVDSGVTEGQAVSVHYDPMLAKLITWGATRQQALHKMRWALAHYPVLGVTTNMAFLYGLMTHPAFEAGEFDTHFLERVQYTDLMAEEPDEVPMALISAAMALSGNNRQSREAVQQEGPTVNNPWQTAGLWRGNV
jgi:acetyl-CoA carboxylase biotin carboxylase subunit